MMNREIKRPSEAHPITIARNPARVIVTVGGHVLADTREALTLREANYPAVHYIPRSDVDMTRLRRTEHRTYCPYKGDCAYYSLPSAKNSTAQAVWTYEAPYEAVAAIRDHLAFYPNHVDRIEERSDD